MLEKLALLKKGTILITYDSLSHSQEKWKGIASLHKDNFDDPNLYTEGSTALEALERLVEAIEEKNS